MSGIVAVLVYLIALGLPIFLLYRFGIQTWYWHVLAVIASVGLGFVPIPPELQKPGFDLLLGSLFIMLMIWGAGGLILYRRHEHHEKHA